jgi:hypothetical protein
MKKAHQTETVERARPGDVLVIAVRSGTKHRSRQRV